MVEPPSRPQRRRTRKAPRPTNRWKKAGEAVGLILRVAAALAALYGTLSGCGPV